MKLISVWPLALPDSCLLTSCTTSVPAPDVSLLSSKLLDISPSFLLLVVPFDFVCLLTLAWLLCFLELTLSLVCFVCPVTIGFRFLCFIASLCFTPIYSLLLLQALSDVFIFLPCFFSSSQLEVSIICSLTPACLYRTLWWLLYFVWAISSFWLAFAISMCLCSTLR